jgi:hypothetical protein
VPESYRKVLFCRPKFEIGFFFALTFFFPKPLFTSVSSCRCCLISGYGIIDKNNTHWNERNVDWKPGRSQGDQIRLLKKRPKCSPNGFLRKLLHNFYGGKKKLKQFYLLL